MSSRALLCSLLMLAFAAPARAQSTADRRELISQAQELQEQGDHEGALRLAERAAAMQASASLSQMIAEEREATHDLAGAVAAAVDCEDGATRDEHMRDRARLMRECGAMRRRLDALVGRVVVHVPTPPPPGLVVELAGRVLSPAAYDVATRVSPGTVSVDARATGMVSFHADLTVTAGRTATEVTVELAPAPALVAPVVDVPDEEPEVTPPPIEEVAAPPPARASHDDTPMIVGVATAVVAGVALGVALGLHAVAEDRARTYRASPCNGSHTVLSTECGAILDDYQAMFPAAVALDVVAAIAGVTSAVFFGLGATTSDATAALDCGPSGLGVVCRWL